MSDRTKEFSADVVVTTYEAPRTLRLVLLALSRQSVLPRRVLVADDGSGRDTGDMLSALASSLPYDLVRVWQEDNGFRPARSRNNALVQIEGRCLVAFLDQDVLPHSDWLSAHLELGGPGRACLGNALELAEDRSEAITATHVCTGAFEHLHSSPECKRLTRLHAKETVYARLRRIGLGQKTKPRLRSNNFSAWADDLRDVNGFDEEYVGWGQEDDDLGRRLYQHGVKPVVAIRETRATHLGHGRAGPQRWEDGLNVARFQRRNVPVRCVVGLSDTDRTEVKIVDYSRRGRESRTGS